MAFLCCLPSVHEGHCVETAVVVPIIYTVTVMPVNLFYGGSNEHRVWYIIDTVVAVLFGMDMLIQLNSVYHNSSGVLITSR